MKFVGALFLAIQGATAFPAVMETLSRRQSNTCTTSKLCNTKYPVTNAQIDYNPNAPTPAQQASAGRNHCGNLVPCTLFDASEQYVSTTGANAFQSPKSTDLRGPCPGLNAAANHGYLSRNGVQSLTTTITGLGQAFGMSVDLAGFLGAYAIAFDGDIVSMTWSIGGPQATLGVIDSGQGISWSHNKYEGDTSISRCDAYTNNGDAHSLSTTRFAYAYAENEGGFLDMDKFARAFAKNTFRSIGQNPYYFAPLFSTTLVSPAAYNFVIAMMSNHTSNQPAGYLNEDIFKTFFSVKGNSQTGYTWMPGQDRIPNNWYRRPSSQPYTASGGVFGDLLSEFAAYPAAFRFGGNTNGVNTYTGIDLENFSNGVYNAQNLFQGNNLACFMYQNIQQGLPDVLNANPLVTAAATLLQKQFGIAFAGVTCPAVSKFNNNNLPPYPGRSYSPNPPANAPENC